jgi:ElaB/YqjD/DUF883 family membrane-anchored ribosome-binding protein
MARDTTLTENIAEKRIETSTADLQKQIATLKDDIAELTSAVAQYGRAQTAALTAQAKDGLRMVQERGSDGLAQAGDFAGRKYAETEDYVRANPATSVGIAAALGFLVGLLTARR